MVQPLCRNQKACSIALQTHFQICRLFCHKGPYITPKLHQKMLGLSLKFKQLAAGALPQIPLGELTTLPQFNLSNCMLCDRILNHFLCCCNLCHVRSPVTARHLQLEYVINTYFSRDFSPLVRSLFLTSWRRSRDWEWERLFLPVFLNTFEHLCHWL